MVCLQKVDFVHTVMCQRGGSPAISQQMRPLENLNRSKDDYTWTQKKKSADLTLKFYWSWVAWYTMLQYMPKAQ